MKNIADIAKIAGVSKSTVSRYLNNGSVSVKTKQKLDKIIQENDYQPNQFAQSLRAHRTNMIGAIIPRMNSYAVDETVKGVKTICDELNYSLLLNYTNLNVEKELEALETFYRSKVDGIVLMATEITERHLTIINKIQVPVIIVGQEHEQLHCVIHNDFHAGYVVGQALGKSQYKNVKFFGVTESDIAVGIDRKSGLIAGLREYSIEPSISLTSFNYQEALFDVTEELETQPHFDAIVGATDSIALAVHKYTSEHHKKVDKQFIVGFGGNPVTEIVSPSISTVIYHFEYAGEVAMNQLNQMIMQQAIEKRLTIDVTLAFKY
ncbi:LacI family DNA-binding transcriptional regulator [Staphylococcus sp. ACRSN]|uniref:LacI family DNA-binding transcriptional regulator n=1 Tax=Staphylococcus sp. ACRSN TaxID=2918214 RepID=UPI001EF1F5CF|nr:LacI family DNA-binding transcriptional regulator [Staphylococcus sp. ACRSN]MCG7339931.1 LacI family DNA-binding transcriptional regulator [Staphylococcus sp. ACRSN]